MPHFCYALRCDIGGNVRVRSYVGYTVDPIRRLRQHNGEIKGGAKRTTRAVRNGVAQRGEAADGVASPLPAWRFVFVIQVDESAARSWCPHTALSLEWHLKGLRRKWRGTRDKGGASSSVARRIELLKHALSLPKFAPFLRHMTIWTQDGSECNDIWLAVNDLADSLGLSMLDAPCVMPFSSFREGWTNTSTNQKKNQSNPCT